MFTCGPAFFTAAQAAILPDPYFAQTVLLAHFDALDGSGNALDSSSKARTLTPNSNATISTAQARFGAASSVSTSSLRYWSIVDSDDWDFGAGAFTAECQVYFTIAPGTNRRMFFGRWSGTTDIAWLFDMNTGNLRFLVSVDGTTLGGSVISAWTPALNTWHHIAAARDGSGNLRLFINGVLVATASANVTIRNSSQPLTISSTSTASIFGHDGFIDEIRITKGIARYTATFTPPSAAFPNF